MSKTRKSREAGQPAAMPQEGGSYVRRADGWLERRPHRKAGSQAGREDSSKRPQAGSEAVKEE